MGKRDQPQQIADQCLRWGQALWSLGVHEIRLGGTSGGRKLLCRE